MPEVTKILYDVSGAVKNLKKLNDETKKAGKGSEDSFDGISDTIDHFGDVLKDVFPNVTKVAGALGNVTKVSGPTGLAVAGVGAAGTALVSAFIDIPGLLVDSSEALQQFREESQKLLQFRNIISDVGDQFILDELERISLATRSERELLTRTQGRTRVAQQEAQKRVEIAKQEFASIESELEASIRREQELRGELLGDDTGGDVEAAKGGFTGAQAVTRLTSAAEEAALQGNVNFAKELLAEAQNISKEFQTNRRTSEQLADAQEAINEQIQQQIKEEENLQDKLKERLRQAEATKQAEMDTLNTLKGQIAALTLRKEALEADENVTGRARETQVRSNARAQGEREFRTAVNDLRETFGRSFTFTERFLQELQTNVGLLNPSYGSREEQQTVNQSLNQIQRNLGQFFQQIVADPSAGNVLDIGKQIQRQRELFQSLRRRAPGENFGTSDEIANRIQLELELFAKLIKSFATANLKPDETFEEGRRRLGQASAEELRRARAVPGNRAARTEQLNQAVERGDLGPRTININATIKGGIVDKEVTQQFTDIVRKELRKQTTQPTN